MSEVSLCKPNPYDSIRDSGKGERGAHEITKVLEWEEKATCRSEERNVEVLGCRLGDREPSKDTEIELSIGRYRYDRAFSKSGGVSHALT